MNKFILITYFLLIGLMVFNCQETARKPSLKERFGFHSQELVFSQDTLFLSSFTWGILGNHNIIFLTDYKKEDRVYDQERDYIYQGEYIIYYSTTNDTLRLYVGHKSNVPPKFNPNVKIIQTKLNGSEFSKYHKNYQKMGLQKYDGF